MNYEKPISELIYYEKPILELIARIDALEAWQDKLAEAVLEYVIADLAEPWVPAARRLEAVLVARLNRKK